MKESWVLLNLDSGIEERDSVPGLSPILLQVMENRGISGIDSMEKFLYPELSPFHSPFLLKGMDQAVERIRLAADRNEKVAIFADSDLDGITSLTIMHDILTKIGLDVHIRYPNSNESYGLSLKIIDEFLEKGITMAITVDSGIRDVSEIAHAMEGGIDFIVTDHHEPDDILPKAIVINPKQTDCAYPCRDLAGVGVAFKLAKAIMFSYVQSLERNYYLLYWEENSFSMSHIHRGNVDYLENVEKGGILDFLHGIPHEDSTIVFCNEYYNLDAIGEKFNNLEVIYFSEFIAGVSPGEFSLIDFLNKRNILFSKNDNPLSLFSRAFLNLQLGSKKKLMEKIDYYSSLATLGTIADMVPLRGENRSIVKHGLKVLNQGGGHGGVGIILGNKTATARSLSWDVAPMLNAPGRLGQTHATVEFFLEEDEVEIQEIIRDLNRLNRQRRGIVSEALERISKQNNNFSDLDDNLFYWHDEEIPEGISGLVANRITDMINKPVIILSNSSAKDCFKGSGRCPDGLNFFKHVEQFSSEFERLGGHSQAFGFTLHNSRVNHVMEKINQSLSGTAIKKEYIIDHVLDIDQINMKLIDEIMLLEPYGKDNPEPLFCSEKINPQSFSKFGVTQKHGKFLLGRGIEVIGWNMAEIMEKKYHGDETIDILYKIEKHEYMGFETIRLLLIDID